MTCLSQVFWLAYYWSFFHDKPKLELHRFFAKPSPRFRELLAKDHGFAGGAAMTFEKSLALRPTVARGKFRFISSVYEGFRKLVVSVWGSLRIKNQDLHVLGCILGSILVPLSKETPIYLIECCIARYQQSLVLRPSLRRCRCSLAGRHQSPG